MIDLKTIRVALFALLVMLLLFIAMYTGISLFYAFAIGLFVAFVIVLNKM